ncbi:hypothetical protein HH214_01570 [Mucilaginibacter robiniae]|uniref:Uncharacterized protein n=1 Tax=Mucilaginibacter robiniae TaxID=2728022 RepID=A0A7L5DXB8_9SPHI|nr:hypothetical protein [Mucilaginibacter robiniae]QJD94649.1 hypothetical protein HH214_01570 [Mucilaginibacter robiniae]
MQLFQVNQNAWQIDMLPIDPTKFLKDLLDETAAVHFTNFFNFGADSEQNTFSQLGIAIKKRL